MKTPEEVAREILDAMWERVGNEGFDEDATTPALVRIIRARDAEVRAEALAEVKRLREGIEHLTRVGYSHTPDCEHERELAFLDWHPDCGLCWEDRLLALLNPTEGETDE